MRGAVAIPPWERRALAYILIAVLIGLAIILVLTLTHPGYCFEDLGFPVDFSPNTLCD